MTAAATFAAGAAPDLYREQALLRAVASESDMVALFDADDRLIYANSMYRDLFLPGHDGPIAFPDILRYGFARGIGVKIDCGDIEQFLTNILPRRRSVARRSLEVDIVDGRWLWITETLLPDGLLMCHGSDITSLKQSERTLKQAKTILAAQAQALTRSNEELEQFAYAVSHDLQAPLRNIGSFAQLLSRRLKRNGDESCDELFQMIDDSLDRMRQLMDGLLRYSRLDGDLRRNAVPLGEAVSEALANLDEAVRNSGAVVRVSELPSVVGDRVQLVQLFQNLIANAIKFHGIGAPQVQIRSEHAGDEWIVSVSDQGIGIDSRFTERIFQIFQRLHTEEEYPGTGIGLALCRKIVSRHSGRIWAQSAGKGQGACFSVALPASGPLGLVIGNAGAVSV